ncbi:MAG TPA: hypothetical protein VG106_00325, partial [Vicinamibacterales bacterium]|nr:hypothetical protein [Vicinamibacterales bacterium]
MAVLFGGSASASLQPIPRTVGEREIPRVRAAPDLPAWTGRRRVIVTLGMAPLARAELGRTFSAAGATRRLNVAAASSRAYLARIDAAQRRAISVLRREVPQAHVQRRYRVILNGLAVSVPAQHLRELGQLDFV